MFRLSKLTDYGIVILAELASRTLAASDGEAASTSASMNARELAEQVDLPLPVVSKVLKALTRAEILESQRGTKGGYSLAQDPAELTVSAMNAALERRGRDLESRSWNERPSCRRRTRSSRSSRSATG